MINYINGDISTVRAGIIAHQTNILGIAGSGVVTSISDAFPNWAIQYIDLCRTHKDNPNNLLGHVQFFEHSPSLHVANLFAQFSVKPFNRNTDLIAFEKAIKQLHQIAEHNNRIVYMIDRIACVRGGMDWDTEILPILEKYFKTSNVELNLVHYVAGQQV